MALARITLVLARAPAHPLGSVDHRLELLLKLTPQGRPAAMPGTARHLAGGDICAGEIVPQEHGWGLRREGAPDAPWWRMTAQLLRPGALAMLLAPGGAELVYRVVAVDAEPGAKPGAEPAPTAD